MPCFRALRAARALPSEVFGPRDFAPFLPAGFGTRIGHGDGRARRGANTGHGGVPCLGLEGWVTEGRGLTQLRARPIIIEDYRNFVQKRGGLKAFR